MPLARAPLVPHLSSMPRPTEKHMRWRDALARRPGGVASAQLGLIGAVLVGAMACAATLAYQARVAYRSQAAQAAQALHHFASFASWQFANSARREFEAVATVTVGLGAHEMLNASAGRAPQLANIRRFAGKPCRGCDRRPLPVLGYFRLALADAS